jgi:hypothetical protein
MQIDLVLDDDGLVGRDGGDKLADSPQLGLVSESRGPTTGRGRRQTNSI